MEFQPNLEQIKENEEANHSTPLLGGLSGFLGLQVPGFPRGSASSRASLLRRRLGAPLSRFPPYLHPEGSTTRNQHCRPAELDLAFHSLPLHERAGCYSCPQTPIHCAPPALRPRPPRWDHSSYSLAPAGLLPDTPGRMPPPPSSALPWLCPEGAFSFPEPASEPGPVPKLLPPRPPPPRLSMDIPSPADCQAGPLSARGLGGRLEKAFSFTPPSRNPIPNNSSGSNNSIAGNLCNGGSNSNFCSHGNFAPTATCASIIGGPTTISPAPSVVSPPAATQQPLPNDSGISLVEGDLLGPLMPELGKGQPPGRKEMD